MTAVTEAPRIITIEDIPTDDYEDLVTSDAVEGSAHYVYPEFYSEHSYTQRSVAEAGSQGLVASDEHGRLTFAGWPVITRHTERFEGYIDIRSWTYKEESILIDSKVDPRYREDYQRLADRFDRSLSQHSKDGVRTGTEQVLSAIHDAVQSSMGYDLDFVLKHAEKLDPHDAAQRIVNLGYYLANGKGVCRHMAAAAGWLAETQSEQGSLEGSVQVHAGQRVRRRDGEVTGGHEWMRFTDREGVVYIVDPTINEKFVKLEYIVDDHYKKYWDYFMPGERETYLAKRRGKVAVVHAVEPTLAEVYDNGSQLPNKDEKASGDSNKAHEALNYTNGYYDKMITSSWKHPELLDIDDRLAYNLQVSERIRTTVAYIETLMQAKPNPTVAKECSQIADNALQWAPQFFRSYESGQDYSSDVAGQLRKLRDVSEMIADTGHSVLFDSSSERELNDVRRNFVALINNQLRLLARASRR